ncbi:hypothetical protein VTN00DRAFT_3637 [Thermoascus crustaceus]|uniref:uncharacterized protein n=1 Tax=Thermoascus crustaceus TaxID=5088 RepID=UPI0037423003
MLARPLSIWFSVSSPPSGSVTDALIPAAEFLRSVPEPEPEPAGREPEEAADAVPGVEKEEVDEEELECDDMNLREDGGTVADDNSGSRGKDEEDEDEDEDDDDDDNCLPVNGDEANLRRFDDGPSLTARRGKSRVDDDRRGTRALDPKKSGEINSRAYPQRILLFRKLSLNLCALEASDLNRGVRS